MTKLQIVGGGKMGQALIGGMLAAGWADAPELAVVEVDQAQQANLSAAFPGVDVIDQPRAGVDTLVAVKPHLVVPVCEALTSPTRIISIAAGVTIATIEAALSAGSGTSTGTVPVIRVMPNTPSLVGAGAAGLAGGTHASDDDVDWAVTILSSVGEAVVVAESLLDAVTGVSGSGPAYLFLMAEALTDAGVARGLPRPTAEALARQTIYGAGKLMATSDADLVELRASVTTPAGTTAAGLGALEANAFRAAVAQAVAAATDRSIELGQA